MSASADGLLNVLKPPGMTSHDVVRVVRRLTGGKVGHTGTLDPLAGGVLLLTLGVATRLSDYLTAEDKTYRAEFILGLETDTLDLEGATVHTCCADRIGPESLRAHMADLTGDIEMLPPMFSAVKQDGKRLYELARKGKDVVRKPRHVRVLRFDLLRFQAGPQATALCEIECSKGTYIRSLAQMLGQRLRCGGCLGFLLRIAQGVHQIRDSVTLEELIQSVEDGSLQELIVPLVEAVPDLPNVSVDGQQTAALRNGNAVPCAVALQPGTKVLVLHETGPVCLAQVSPSAGAPLLQPRKVFPVRE